MKQKVDETNFIGWKWLKTPASVSNHSEMFKVNDADCLGGLCHEVGINENR